MRQIIKLFGLNKESITALVNKVADRYSFDFFVEEEYYDARLTVIFEGFTQERADDVLAEIYKIFGGTVYSLSDISLEETVVELLYNKNLMLVTAESCTGGLVASSIISVAGASAVFYEGIITYSNDSKADRLGVSAKALKEFGAVSAEVAAEMAIGAVRRRKGFISVSVTGIAGPSGGTEDQPVGLVYFGVAGESGVKTYKHILEGNRDKIRKTAANTALFYLIQNLK